MTQAEISRAKAPFRFSGYRALTDGLFARGILLLLHAAPVRPAASRERPRRVAIGILRKVTLFFVIDPP